MTAAVVDSDAHWRIARDDEEFVSVFVEVCKTAAKALGVRLPPGPPRDARALATIALTLDTYSHATPALHREAAVSVNALLERTETVADSGTA